MSVVETIRLDLPNEWVEFPLGADDVDTFIRERMQGDMWDRLSPTERRVFQNFLHRITNELAAQRCQMAAVYAEAPGTDGEDETPESERLVAAGMFVTRLTGFEMGTPLQLSPEVLLAALSMRSDDEVVEDVEPPTAVDLAAGPCARTRRLQSLDATEGSRVYVEQYLFPVAPDYDELFLLQFTTPNIPLARHFSALFEAIAGTFMMYREGEPAGA